VNPREKKTLLTERCSFSRGKPNNRYLLTVLRNAACAREGGMTC
jgi:hypothetical protein